MDDLLQEMIDPEPPRRDAARRRRLWASIAVFSLAAVGVTSLTTSALFTDTDSVAGDLLTGTVDISSQMAQFTLPTGGLAPGDTVTDEVTVTNSGSLQLRYAILYEAASEAASSIAPSSIQSPTLGTTPSPGTGDLRNMLSLSVWPKSGTTCTGAPTPTSTTSNTSIGGAVGVVNSDSTTGTNTFQPLLGSNITGQNTNDRTLGATASEVLCVSVHMDQTADNTYQYTAAKITLRFDAEQVVNNTATVAP